MTHFVYLPIISKNDASLKELFGNFGIQFGFSVSSGSFVNKIMRSIIVQHANLVTTEVALKMEHTQPEQGKWDWDEVDKIVGSAQELGIDVHGHTVSWALQNPDWLVNGSFTYEQLDSILREHVSWTTYRNRDKFVTFDSANEAYINEDGSVYGGPWQPLDEDYVAVSLKCTLAKNKPMYNSFFPHPDQEYPRALDLLDKGWVDGIGIQLHLWTGSYQETLDKIETLLKQIRQRGKWCRFSEVGVLGEGVSQAVAYVAITRLAIEYKDIVKGIVVWGVKDPVWRGNVTLFDNSGQPKLSYYAIVDELKK